MGPVHRKEFFSDKRLALAICHKRDVKDNKVMVDDRTHTGAMQPPRRRHEPPGCMATVESVFLTETDEDAAC